MDWVSGACLLVRRADAEAVGLLDERYFMYCEDVDFCAAIRRRGGRVYFTPAAEVVHFGGRSGHADRPATEAAYRRSHLAFYEKHHPGLGSRPTALSGDPRKAAPWGPADKSCRSWSSSMVETPEGPKFVWTCGKCGRKLPNGLDIAAAGSGGSPGALKRLSQSAADPAPRAICVRPHSGGLTGSGLLHWVVLASVATIVIGALVAIQVVPAREDCRAPHR